MEANHLNPILHQPVRTRIAAFLSARGESTFTELKKALAVTDGNLDAHIKKLVAAEYIVSQKERGKGRPQTLYCLSDKGKEAFHIYLNTLQQLLNFD